MARHYEAASGERIELADYDRWIRQATAAIHVLDENFNDGEGPEDPEDQQAQLSDLLCHLMHFAQLKGFDFADALFSAEANYEAEKRPEGKKEI